MDTLRWILLAVGVLVIVIVYLVSRRTRRDIVDEISEADPVQPLQRDEPRVEIRRRPAETRDVDRELAQMGNLIAENRRTDPAPAARAANPARKPESPVRLDDTQSAPPVEEKLVILYVVAPPGGRFAGADVLRAVEAAGFSYGQMQIFHRLSDPAQPQSATVFSLANMVQPGSFDFDRMDDFTTPGLSLFMQLPGPMNGLTALDSMIAAARRIATELNGELRDQSRSVLGKQTIEHLRTEIMEYQRRQRLANAAP